MMINTPGKSSYARGLFIIPIILFFAIESIASGNHYCDTNLRKLVENKSGILLYQPRGKPVPNRCEGIYEKEVAGYISLAVVSLTESFIEYDLESSDPIKIKWQSIGKNPVWLRAQNLDRSLIYRMDTARPSDETTFSWETNILRQLNLKRHDIGIICWTQYRSNGKDIKVLIPLQISQHLPSKIHDYYSLKIIPSFDLKEIYYDLINYDTREKIVDNKSLEYGLYPAETEIPINIQKPQSEGIYRVSVKAEKRNGEPIITGFLFYHNKR